MVESSAADNLCCSKQVLVSGTFNFALLPEHADRTTASANKIYGFDNQLIFTSNGLKIVIGKETNS